ncbi:MAG: hypothetical protein R3D62_04115 [Xanthobacteraceae bacterium]
MLRQPLYEPFSAGDLPRVTARDTDHHTAAPEMQSAREMLQHRVMLAD